MSAPGTTGLGEKEPGSHGRPRAAAAARQVATGAGLALLCVLIGWLCILRWEAMAAGEKRDLLEKVAALRTMPRAAVQAEWGLDRRTHKPNTTRWLPAMDPQKAPEALAILPRTPEKDFDAIYVLYEGDRTSSTLAVTPIGTYFNGNLINIEQHGNKLYGPRLAPAEARDAARIEKHLEAEMEATRKAHPEDVQSQRYLWTHQVVEETLKPLLAAQGNAKPE